MFELPNQQVKLIKTSTPMENHGQKHVLATVLTIEACMSCQVLDQFSPGLRDALFRMPTEADGVDLATDTSAPSVRRHAKMSPFDMDVSYTGYEAVVDYGLGGDSNIRLIDAKVDSFTLAPMEGGTVSVRFNIIVHPAALDVGRLCEMQKQNIDLMLTPPAPSTVHELFGDDKKAA